MNTNKSHSKKSSHALAIGAGLTALAATVAGAYYLYGTETGKKKRKVMQSWMLKMKADVMDEIEHLKDLNEDLYYAAVEKIADKYKKVQNIDPAEVMLLAKRMQQHWKDIKKDLNDGAKTVKKMDKVTRKKLTKSTRK